MYLIKMYLVSLVVEGIRIDYEGIVFIFWKWNKRLGESEVKI